VTWPRLDPKIPAFLPPDPRTWTPRLARDTQAVRSPPEPSCPIAAARGIAAVAHARRPDSPARPATVAVAPNVVGVAADNVDHRPSACPAPSLLPGTTPGTRCTALNNSAASTAVSPAHATPSLRRPRAVRPRPARSWISFPERPPGQFRLASKRRQRCSTSSRPNKSPTASSALSPDSHGARARNSWRPAELQGLPLLPLSSGWPNGRRVHARFIGLSLLPSVLLPPHRAPRGAFLSCPAPMPLLLRPTAALRVLVPGQKRHRQGLEAPAPASWGAPTRRAKRQGEGT
jgi:hypothetical protein